MPGARLTMRALRDPACSVTARGQERDDEGEHETEEHQWPRASTVTSWLPFSTVVMTVRSIGVSLGEVGEVGTDDRVRAASSCGRT
jgi:hypothetical protein